MVKQKAEAIRMVEAGIRMLVLPGDTLKFVLVRREDLPLFGLTTPVAVVQADLGIIHDRLRERYPEDGTFDTATIRGITGLSEISLQRWLRLGLITWTWRPKPGRKGHRRFTYLDLLSATLSMGLRHAPCPAPDAVLRAVTDFLLRPVAWKAPAQASKQAAAAAAN